MMGIEPLPRQWAPAPQVGEGTVTPSAAITAPPQSGGGWEGVELTYQNLVDKTLLQCQLSFARLARPVGTAEFRNKKIIRFLLILASKLNRPYGTKQPFYSVKTKMTLHYRLATAMRRRTRWV